MSFNLTHRNLKGLKISDVEIKPVFAGDDLIIAVSVYNPDMVRNNIVFEVDGFGEYNAPLRMLKKGIQFIKSEPKLRKGSKKNKGY